MQDDFKRAQMKATSPGCGPDCCGRNAKKHGSARSSLKLDLRRELEELEQTCPYCGEEGVCLGPC